MSSRLAVVSTALFVSAALTACVNVAPASTPASPANSEPFPPATVASREPAAAPSAAEATPATVPASTAASTPVATHTAGNGQAGGSIVYVSSGDIWIANPDGTGARQLTTDGSESAYHDPSQAPDGTIYALRGATTLVAVDRSTGAAVQTDITLPTLENGAEGLTVAPDGTHIAYTTTGYGHEIDPRFGTPTGTFIYGGTDVAGLDGKSVPNAAMASMIFPSWIGSSALAVGDGVKIYVASVGAQPVTWLDESNGCLTDIDCPQGQKAAANVAEPSVSSDGGLVAYTTTPYYGAGGRDIARITARPPQPPAVACTIPDQENYSDPGSFAPDGSAFAYDDTSFDPTTFETTVGEGIYVLHVDVTRPDCGAATATLVIPGGAQPDWSALAP